MWTRREFIKTTAWATGTLLTPEALWAIDQENGKKSRLVILHTNDVHSRMEAFPMDGGRNQGLGGVEARAALIKEIREQEDQVLLLDAGDIFQGTPYFNIYKGEPEMKAMAAMGYDAATMGNHDFDAGLENFVTQLQHGKFSLLVCNYNFSGTVMEDNYKPWQVFKKGKLRVGITGVGINGAGLIPENLWDKTQYLDPIQKANETAYLLKKQKKCDFVICLSHLGYQYKDDKNRVCDEILAKESEHIDLIIGGHTHTFLDAPVNFKNKWGSDVIVNQVGWAGIRLGRLDFEFSGEKKKNLVNAHSVIIGKKTNE